MLQEAESKWRAKKARARRKEEAREVEAIQRAQAREDWRHNNPTQYESQIKEGRITPGMTKTECQVAWDHPVGWEMIHRQITLNGRSEAWKDRGFNLAFDDDVLVSISEWR